MNHALALLLAVSAVAAEPDVMPYPSRTYPLALLPPPCELRAFRHWLSLWHTPTTVHAFLHRSEITYVVFSTVLDEDARFGERHIYWIATRGGAVVGYQQHYLDSSWRPISGGIDGWRHGILSWGAEGMFAHGDDLVDEGYSGFFDPKTPEQGLRVKETYKLPIQ